MARILPPGGYDFARALFAGATLAEAAETSAGEALDPGSHIVGLLEAGAIPFDPLKEKPMTANSLVPSLATQTASLASPARCSGSFRFP